MPDLSVKHCHKCGEKTLISDSRVRKDDRIPDAVPRLARRRYCPTCGAKHTTVEIMQAEYDELITIRELLRKVAIGDYS